LRKYGINNKYILCVGNIEPRKNQEDLLKAFKMLPSNITNNYSIVFVGADGWKNDSFYKLVNNLSKTLNIIILKNIVKDSDMPMFYSGASVSVNPSFYEGFGMPTIEAMACRTPVVVSDIDVMHEVAGDKAIFVNPYDIKDVAEGIRQSLVMDEEQKKVMVDSNYLKASTYSWDDSAKALIDTVKKLS